jgi:acetylornithine deacetylase/succinyl-diaminopimelate desuccinylase-like protein
MHATPPLPLAVPLCQSLVRIPSVNPDDNPGTTLTGEARCATWIAEWLRAEFPDVHVTTPEVLPDRPNVVACFGSASPNKPRLLFAPHTDTVSIVGMTIDPFGGEIRDGRIYGRGASDTKGPMAAMLAALHACKDILPRLSHEIWFAGLAGEEAGQHGAHALAARETFDLVIAGEPTEMDFVHTHKGSMFVNLTMRGIAVHAAKPEAGYNAIYPMAEVLKSIREEVSEWLKTFTHPVLGHSTISVGTIHGGSKTNVVPDFCQATVDIRLVPGQDAEFEEELFARLRHVHPELEISVLRSHPLHTNPAHPLLDRLSELGARAVGAPWFCDAAVFAKHGSPAIAMGPGSIAQAHTKDEWIALENLEKGASFFEAFLRSLVVPQSHSTHAL